jgi:hypothetical protein
MYLLFTEDYTKNIAIMLSNGCRLKLLPCEEGFYLESSFALGLEKINELQWPYNIVESVTIPTLDI